MSDADTRTTVHIHTEKMGMYDKETLEIDIASQTESLDDLIRKAKKAIGI